VKNYYSSPSQAVIKSSSFSVVRVKVLRYSAFPAVLCFEQTSLLPAIH